MKLESSPGFLKNPGSDSGLAFGGWGGGVGGWGGGDDNDSVTQTHQTVSPQEPFYSVFTVLSSCRTISYSHQLYSGLCEVDIGLCEGFRRKL